MLDVKVGRGAFMKTRPEARRLAEAMVAIGAAPARRSTALLTDMDQPLGLAIGNALEVARGDGAAARRRPGRPARAHGGPHRRDGAAGPAAPRTCASARRAVEAAIADGRGLAKWRELVAAQGGDPRIVDEPDRLPRAATLVEVASPVAGLVEAIDGEALGLAAMALGAGRARVEDRVDPAVGLMLLKKVGDRVARDEPLVVVHRNQGGEPQPRVAARILAAYAIGPGPVAPPPLILERMAEP